MDALSRNFAFPPFRLVLKDDSTGDPFDWLSDQGAAVVETPGQRSAAGAPYSIADLTTTQQRIPFPGGAKWVHVLFEDIGTTAVSAQYLKLVAGTQQVPITEVEATGRFTIPGAHYAFPFGLPVTMTFSPGNLCLSLDVISAVAVGSGKTLLTVVGGV